MARIERLLRTEILDFTPGQILHEIEIHFTDVHSIITVRSKDLRVGLDLEIDKAMQGRGSDWRDMYQHVRNAIILRQ